MKEIEKYIKMFHENIIIPEGYTLSEVSKKTNTQVFDTQFTIEIPLNGMSYLHTIDRSPILNIKIYSFGTDLERTFISYAGGEKQNSDPCHRFNNQILTESGFIETMEMLNMLSHNKLKIKGITRMIKSIECMLGGIATEDTDANDMISAEIREIRINRTL